MTEERLPDWLKATQLLFWSLRALEQLGGRAHLDSIYNKLGQLLRIPTALLRLKYPPSDTGGADDYVVRHRMRFALTDLGHLGYVHTSNTGNWSLTREGRELLRQLEDDPEKPAKRGWSEKSGVGMTSLEKRLQRDLVSARKADHKSRYPRRRYQADDPPRVTPKVPSDWPKGPFISRGRNR